jgi:hypothetical protein
MLMIFRSGSATSVFSLTLGISFEPVPKEHNNIYKCVQRDHEH